MIIGLSRCDFDSLNLHAHHPPPGENLHRALEFQRESIADCEAFVDISEESLMVKSDDKVLVLAFLAARLVEKHGWKHRNFEGLYPVAKPITFRMCKSSLIFSGLPLFLWGDQVMYFVWGPESTQHLDLETNNICFLYHLWYVSKNVYAN